MFNLEKQIEAWRCSMTRAGIAQADLLGELENHLREEFERQRNSGLADSEAFQGAVALLGDGVVLKREFAKIAQPFLLRSNPWTLNVVAAWFIIAGFNAISSMGMWRHTGFDWPVLIPITMELVICSQIFIGIGLLHRKEFCRELAVGWSRCSLLLFACGQAYVHFIASKPTTAHSSSLGVAVISMSGPRILHYQFLGMTLPVVFCNIISMINIGMLIWACYLFTRTRVRDLFQRVN